MNRQNEQFDLILNVVSLVIGLMNFQENLTQSDKQDIVNNFDKKTEFVLNEIHSHLEKQDKKIDEILLMIKELK